MSKVCRKCGNMMGDEAMFCEKCGTQVAVPQPQQQSVVVSKSASNIMLCKIGVIIASVLMMLSTMVNYVTIDGDVIGFLGRKGIIKKDIVKLIDKDTGFIMIVLAVLSIVFVCMCKEKALLVTGVLTMLIGGAISMAYTYPKILFQELDSEVISENQERLRGLIHEEMGFFLLAASAIALLVLSIVYYKQRKKAENNK